MFEDLYDAISFFWSKKWPVVEGEITAVDVERIPTSRSKDRFRLAVADSDRLLYRNIDAKRASGERGPDILSLLLDARDEDGKAMSNEERIALFT